MTLKALRGAIVFMVRYGFALSDLRQLYIDEFFAYFEELVCLLEKEGVLKEGSSSAFKSDTETVNELRRQISKLKR